MELFYTPNFQANNYTLSPEESNHCINVLRHKTGDLLAVTDGNGHLYSGTIIEAHHKRCRIEVSDTKESAAIKPYLHIAIAPTKNIERLEWFLEKTTEIGINEITPLLCHHSERKQLRIDRLEKITVSAMKQSGQYHVPKLNELTPFKQFINNNFAGFKGIAHCDKQPRSPLKQLIANHQHLTLMIGPEGDFSPAEIELAYANGFNGISLGNSRLRTETAGIVACHTVRLLAE